MHHNMQVKGSTVMLGGQNTSNSHQEDSPVRELFREKKYLNQSLLPATSYLFKLKSYYLTVPQR